MRFEGVGRKHNVVELVDRHSMSLGVNEQLEILQTAILLTGLWRAAGNQVRIQTRSTN